MTRPWAGYSTKAGTVKTLGDYYDPDDGDYVSAGAWDSVTFSSISGAHEYAKNGARISAEMGWYMAQTLYEKALATWDLTKATDLVHQANYAAEQAMAAGIGYPEADSSAFLLAKKEAAKKASTTVAAAKPSMQEVIAAATKQAGFFGSLEATFGKNWWIMPAGIGIYLLLGRPGEKKRGRHRRRA